MKNAILFAVDKKNMFIESQLKKLYEDISGRTDSDFFILYNDRDDNKINDNDYFSKFNIFNFNKQSVSKLGFNMHYYYPLRRVKTDIDFYGNNFEYSFMSFYKNNLNYDYYWIIEYDVVFNGDWNYFFDYFTDKNEDLITNHIIEYDKFKDYWALKQYFFDKTIGIKDEEKIKSFNPIFRISNKALEYLCNVYNDGNYGFYEIFMPTVLKHGGFSIKQLGGKVGKYTYDVDDLFTIGDCQDDNGQFFERSEIESDFVWYELGTDRITTKNKLYHKITGRKNVPHNNKWTKSYNALDFLLNLKRSIDLKLNRV